jgi:3-methyladenine DNA glycosylase AlkD
MTHALVRAARNALEQAEDPATARAMQAYMKSAMPFRGVSAPEQRRIWTRVFSKYPLESFDEWKHVALELWLGAAFREERYAAIGLTDLRRYASYRTFAAVPMFEEMIVTGAWWDFVDALATHQLGDILRTEPRRMTPLMRQWAKHPDMWKRRAAILCQIRLKRETDLDLLYACIAPNLADRDFFIRKAIGWALRQYAWTDAKEIRRYVAANRSRLSPLSVREAMKNVRAPAATKR